MATGNQRGQTTLWKGRLMEIILDSNVIIYFSDNRKKSLRSWLKHQALTVSAISQIEVLGFHKITETEKYLTTHFFSKCRVVENNPQIIQKSIHLRQQKKMSLGDAIMAATAITEKLPLVTANTQDFKHIKDLELIDPLTV